MSTGVELLSYGLGRLAAWEVHEQARKRFPNATGFEISYRGRGGKPLVLPKYERTSSAARSQHEALERRLRQIKATLW